MVAGGKRFLPEIGVGGKKEISIFFSPSNHLNHDDLRKLREAVQRGIKSTRFIDNFFVAHPISPPLPLPSYPYTSNHAETLPPPLDNLHHRPLCPGGTCPNPRASSRASSSPLVGEGTCIELEKWKGKFFPSRTFKAC